MSHLQEPDLQAYLERIGFEGAPSPDLHPLESLHPKHLAGIPFENVDIWLGRPGSLHLEALQSKIVRAGRGGCCFEQNTLFAAVLRTVGFRVKTLEARVWRPDATSPLPRTHMLLQVEIEGRGFVADVGFGADGPRARRSPVQHPLTGAC